MLTPKYSLSDGKYQTKKAAIDWNEDVMIPDDDDDEDKPKDAPVKLEKKYGAKTVATVNNLDERLIPYDLVGPCTDDAPRIVAADLSSCFCQIVRLLERLCFEDPTYAQYSASVLIFMPGLYVAFHAFRFGARLTPPHADWKE